MTDLTETGNLKVHDDYVHPILWSEEHWTQIGLDAMHETELWRIRQRAWLLMPTPRRVLGTARTLHEATQSSERDQRRSIVPARTAAILLSAITEAMDTPAPWTQAQFDDLLRALADPKDVAAADATPLDDLRLTVS